MKDKLIAVRVSSKIKNKIQKIAKRKGFINVSAFLYWLIQQQTTKTLSLVFILGLLGCASVSFLPAINFQNFSPSQSVEIFYEKPDKPYMVLGKIIVESGDISEQGLYKRLKQKATNIGADAIIIQSTSPAGTDKYGSVTHRIEGLAIKWQQNLLPPSNIPK